jgi:hypothetical protein
MDTKRDCQPSKKRTADPAENRQHCAGEKDAPYGRAVEAFRTAESTVPGWDETKRMILTRHQREHTMIPNDKNTTTAWTRKPALIGAFSFIILIAFFAVPFSQTTEIGARLVFELSEPSGELQQLDFAGILDDPSYGIDQWNTSISLDNEDGPLVINLLLLTEDPGAPGAVLAALTAEYPALAAAETTISPVNESSSGTFFNRLTGELEVQVNCEGMSAVEIEDMIRQSLVEQGAEGVDVQVIESEDGEERQLMISVTADQDTDE